MIIRKFQIKMVVLSKNKIIECLNNSNDDVVRKLRLFAIASYYNYTDIFENRNDILPSVHALAFALRNKNTIVEEILSKIAYSLGYFYSWSGDQLLYNISNMITAPLLTDGRPYNDVLLLIQAEENKFR